MYRVLFSAENVELVLSVLRPNPEALGKGFPLVGREDGLMPRLVGLVVPHELAPEAVMRDAQSGIERVAKVLLDCRAAVVANERRGDGSLSEASIPNGVEAVPRKP